MVAIRVFARRHHWDSPACSYERGCLVCGATVRQVPAGYAYRSSGGSWEYVGERIPPCEKVPACG